MNAKRKTTRHTRWWAALGAIALSGCGLVYTDVHSPYAYRTATPGDVKSASADEVASGKACARSVLFLVAWGDSGYAAATRAALDGKPESILYDVRTDMQVKAYVLGAYIEVCTIVTGRIGHV
jgi:hypothetical protein